MHYLAAGPDDALEEVRVYGFRPSVLVQQIFSLIKQNPTGAVRLADLERLIPTDVDGELARQIISELTLHRYLRPGRLGEWQPDTNLQLLIDQHDIYSNIGIALLAATAVDAYTGQVIAQTERVCKKGTVVLFGGRPMQVMWQNGYRFGLAPTAETHVDEVLRFQKSFAAVPFVVTQTVARLMAIAPGEMISLPQADGRLLVHFWGTVWGELLTAVLRENELIVESVNEYCLYLAQPLDKLTGWADAVAAKAARRTAVTLTDCLEMGRFHSLLPTNVGVEAAVRQLNLPKFRQVYADAIISAQTKMNEKLYMLAQ